LKQDAMTFTCSLLLTAAMATAAPAAISPEAVITAQPAPALTGVEFAAQPPREAPVFRPRTEAWMADRQDRRPAALPIMYATLGALNALDIYSTRQALAAGAHEANPLMKKASVNAGAMTAVKALSMAGTIYFTERAWKKNRKGAIITMAIINGATAAIAAHNLRHAGR
jgi:hypothetical protein